jgi:hypothetical protein
MKYVAVVIALVAGIAVALVSARPNRYGHGDREERHMTTGHLLSGQASAGHTLKCARLSIGVSIPYGTR